MRGKRRNGFAHTSGRNSGGKGPTVKVLYEPFGSEVARGSRGEWAAAESAGRPVEDADPGRKRLVNVGKGIPRGVMKMES